MCRWGGGGVDLHDAHSCLKVYDWAEVRLDPEHGDGRFSKLSLWFSKTIYDQIPEGRPYILRDSHKISFHN